MPAHLVCQCGGEVPRPMPRHCPHCGRLIARVHAPRYAWLAPALVIAGLGGLLFLGVFLLLRLFGG